MKSTAITQSPLKKAKIVPVKEESGRTNQEQLPSLPQEIVETEILKKLPVKSLMRFTSVCKKWRYLILTDRRFDAEHSEQVKRSPWKHPYFLSWKPQERTLSMSTVDCNCNLEDLSLPRDNHPRILGSCDGLFFMQIFRPNSQSFGRVKGSLELVVWNPYTNSMKRISEIVYGDPFYLLMSGLSYDYRTKDYKAITVIGTVPPIDLARRRSKFLAYMFSFRRNSWDFLYDIELILDFSVSGYYLTSTTFNGVPHWVGIYRNTDVTGGFNGLVCFDPATDMFRKMSLPDQEYRGKSHGFAMGVLGGCLCAAATLLGSINVVEVWTMKEYGLKDSWTKLYAIKLLDPFLSTAVKPLGYSSQGKLVMLSVRYPCYNPYRVYWTCDIDGDATAKEELVSLSPSSKFFAQVYTESLIWPWVSD